MDFIVFCGLAGVFLLSLVFSYDIVCQWSWNLRDRVRQLPPHIRVEDSLLAGSKYVLSKFHIFNHSPRCQINYLLNYLKWSGRMNGKEPKRFWAHINPLSMSTREMGDGLREDTMDDHIRSWNFHKITKIGKCQFGLLTLHYSYLI
jgi:hypothetical protein